MAQWYYHPRLMRQFLGLNPGHTGLIILALYTSVAWQKTATFAKIAHEYKMVLKKTAWGLKSKYIRGFLFIGSLHSKKKKVFLICTR